MDGQIGTIGRMIVGNDIGVESRTTSINDGAVAFGFTRGYLRGRKAMTWCLQTIIVELGSQTGIIHASKRQLNSQVQRIHQIDDVLRITTAALIERHHSLVQPSFFGQMGGKRF